MRYSIIAALVSIAAAVPLTETIYNTQVLTITSCGPEVTDCPGKKTAVPVTSTSCTESSKQSYTAPPVYVSTTTSAVVPPVVSTSSAPAPPPVVYTSSKQEKPSTSEAVKTSSAPAPPAYTSEAVKTSSAPAPPAYTSEAVKTSSAPAPPPYTEAPKPSSAVVVVVPTTSAVPAPSSAVTSKPAVGTSYGTASGSTGLVPYKTTSAYWSATSTPAKYTGAASHLNAAGAIVGAGAFAAFFL